ncbi:hypothetical protein FJZ36_09405 [Candidatus Poribacteria bacterium]|nr:hypothetical protein [Candidatus Poribacteria bacterium]
MTEDMLSQLSAYLEGDVTPSERAAIESQLARSTDWRAALDELVALRDAIRSLRVDVPDDLGAGFQPPREPEPPSVYDVIQRLRRTLEGLRSKVAMHDERRRAATLMRTAVRLCPDTVKESYHG